MAHRRVFTLQGHVLASHTSRSGGVEMNHTSATEVIGNRFLEPLPLSRSESLALLEKGRDAVVEKLDNMGGFLFLRFGEEGWNGTLLKNMFTSLKGWTPMNYEGGTNSRGEVSEGLLNVGTEPLHRDLPTHQEMAYSARFPAFIGFACFGAAKEGDGGETTVANAQRIFEKLPAQYQSHLKAEGVKHRFYYSKHAVKTWQQTFFTEDQEVVRRKCEQNKYEDIDFRSVGNSTELGFTYKIPHFVFHPRKKEPTVFQTDISGAWYRDWKPHCELPEKQQPYSMTFGDGMEIEEGYRQAWEAAAKEEELQVRWQVGDFLLVDNFVFMHGRKTFIGDPQSRKLGVLLLEPHVRTVPELTECPRSSNAKDPLWISGVELDPPKTI